MLGQQIYDKEESVDSKEQELRGLVEVMRREGVEVRFKAPADGNCFYHTVGEQVGMTASEVRRVAVEFLRKNERINRED